MNDVKPMALDEMEAVLERDIRTIDHNSGATAIAEQLIARGWIKREWATTLFSAGDGELKDYELPDAPGVWEHEEGDWQISVRNGQTDMGEMLLYAGLKGDRFVCGFFPMLSDDFPSGHWRKLSAAPAPARGNCPDCGGTGGYIAAYCSNGEISGPDACLKCDGTGYVSAPAPAGEGRDELHALADDTRKFKDGVRKALAEHLGAPLFEGDEAPVSKQIQWLKHSRSTPAPAEAAALARCLRMYVLSPAAIPHGTLQDVISFLEGFRPAATVKPVGVKGPTVKGRVAKVEQIHGDAWAITNGHDRLDRDGYWVHWSHKYAEFGDQQEAEAFLATNCDQQGQDKVSGEVEAVR